MEKKVNSQTFQSVKKIEPYIWLLPSILMMGVMILIPIFTVFQSSFSEISKVGVNRGWNGIANYIAVFNNPTFWNTLKNTLKNAWILSLGKPLPAVLILVLMFLPLGLLAISYRFISVLFLLGISGPAYFSSIYFTSLFQKFENQPANWQITEVWC